MTRAQEDAVWYVRHRAAQMGARVEVADTEDGVRVTRTSEGITAHFKVEADGLVRSLSVDIPKKEG